MQIMPYDSALVTVILHSYAILRQDSLPSLVHFFHMDIRRYDNAPGTHEIGPMKGFDPEFTDVVDYILRITERIWEGKQVGLCRDYYSSDCPI